MIDILRATWASGHKTFHELLRADPSKDYAELARFLEIPYPDQVVSVRHIEVGMWPIEDSLKVIVARQDYDAGLVEITTGKFRNHFILYSHVRKHRARSRMYFTEDYE